MRGLSGSDKLPPGVRRIFRLPWNRREMRRDLDTELQFHLQMRIDDLRALGMSEPAAHAEALRRLGDEHDLKAYCLRVDERRALVDRVVGWLYDFGQDLQLAVRQARQRPSFTLLIVATLAVGIAVVTATFSFVNTALYRALPYPLADRSVAIIATPNDWPGNLPLAAVERLRHDTRSFARVSAFYDVGERFEMASRVEPLVGTAVDTGFFATLGAHPERGRFPSAVEVARAAPYVVISHRLWYGELNADPNVIGRALRLGRQLYTVVGVMPPHINYGVAGRTDVWVPQPAVADPGAYYFAFAWLKPGVTLAQARAEVSFLSDQTVGSDPSRYHRLDLYVNDEMVVRRTGPQSRALLLFLAVAACVLFIGCANVTTLLLMRATERRREMAVRASLGAGRARLVRQGLTESLLLAVIAAAIGTALSVVGIRVVAAAFPTGLGTWFRLGIDSHVLLFVLGISAAVVFLVGLTPALDGTRFDISTTLKAGGGFGATSARTLHRGQRAIGVQVAVAVALLITTALLGASYRNIVTADPGYRPDGVLAVWLQTDSTGSAEARTLTEALQENAAVRSAARVNDFAQFQDSAVQGDFLDSIYRTDAPQAVNTGGPMGIRMHVVSDRYFSTLDIPLVRGRRFVPTDTAGTPLVAVLSEHAARAIWAGRGGVGRTFRLGRSGSVITVVGIAGDVHDPMETAAGLSLAGHADLYLSDRQAVGRCCLYKVIVRPTGRQGAAIAAVNDEIRTALPNLDGFRILPYVQTVSEAPTVVRLFGGVIGTCAAIALALSLVGIYGVVGYSVTQRTREIGIRVALGGSIAQIRRHLMLGSLRVGAVGLLVGVFLAFGLARLLRAWMLGVSPTSPMVYLAACVVFAGAAYLAGYVPSRRAARVVPMDALRSE